MPAFIHLHTFLVAYGALRQNFGVGQIPPSTSIPLSSLYLSSPVGGVGTPNMAQPILGWVGYNARGQMHCSPPNLILAGPYWVCPPHQRCSAPMPCSVFLCGVYIYTDSQVITTTLRTLICCCNWRPLRCRRDVNLADDAVCLTLKS